MQTELTGQGIFAGGGGEGYALPQELLFKYGNRHGLIAGATGTGKTVSLMHLAEGCSRLGGPVLLADRRPEVPVLLLHGDADELVPAQFSQDFAAALRAGGHPVTLDIVPGANHGEVYSAPVAAAPVTQWLAGLPQD